MCGTIGAPKFSVGPVTQLPRAKGKRLMLRLLKSASSRTTLAGLFLKIYSYCRHGLGPRGDDRSANVCSPRRPSVPLPPRPLPRKPLSPDASPPELSSLPPSLSELSPPEPREPCRPSRRRDSAISSRATLHTLALISSARATSKTPASTQHPKL